MKSWSLLIFAVLLASTLVGCASEGALLLGANGAYDDTKPEDAKLAGIAAYVAESPFGATGAVWSDPSTESPYFLAQILDPFNYPHMFWRAFYTVWTVPINPVYHLTQEPWDTWEPNLQPIGETVTYDYTPAPHGGGAAFKYWQSRADAISKRMNNSWYSLQYHFMGANTDRFPYDNFYPDSIQRDKTTLHRTIDLHFFNYDWDDAYIN